jgi:hypothetical protein
MLTLSRYIVDQDDFYPLLSTTPAETFFGWKKAHDEILDSIEGFWTCIQHILCTDAPEGHVPDEIDEETSLDTKEILSYSWRGLKEARYVDPHVYSSRLIVPVYFFVS